MHQGLYLGFNGLRSIKSKEMHALWHNPGLPVTLYNHATDPTRPSNDTMSLFNLGSVFVDAATAVEYAALHPDSVQAQGVPLALNRQWNFLQTNGPGIMAESYLRSLGYTVSLYGDLSHPEMLCHGRLYKPASKVSLVD